MKLAIFEPSASGHHMILHVRHVAREALARGWQVRLVTTPETLRHPATQVVLDEGKGRMQTWLMDGGGADEKGGWRLLRQQWRRYQAFVNAYGKIASADRPDAIYLGHLDYVRKFMCLLGSPFAGVPFVCVLIGAWFHHRRMGIMSRRSCLDWFRCREFMRLLRLPSLRCLLTIDETLPEFVRQRCPALGSKVRYVPDMGALSGHCSREEARLALGLKDDDCAILVYGCITERKGVDCLLRAAADPRCRPRAVVLLAGQINSRVEPMLDGPEARLLRDEGRLVVRRGMLADEEEWEVFRAADIAWLGYRGFYSMSGVMAQAGSIGLPVIACSKGLIGWMCDKYRLGEVVDVRHPGQVVEAINRLAEDKGRRERHSLETSLFAERHSPRSFANAVCNAISAD